MTEATSTYGFQIDMLVRLALSLVALIVATSNALAWNSLGHKVVAELAWRQLDPSARQKIVDILRRHPRFDTDFAAKMEDDAQNGDRATQDHWIFQHAATWPDLIRKNKEYDHPAWHYIDFPLYLDPSDHTAFINKLPANISMEYSVATRDQYNVLHAIEYNRRILRSKAPAEAKAIAICWLLHLVGDIHQPLHSTALFSMVHYPKGDRGGNEIKLKRGKNLHSLWDGLLGSQYYMRNVDKVVAEVSDRKRYGDVWDSAGAETDPRKWALESHGLCSSHAVYAPEILDAVRQAQPGEKLQPIELPLDYYRQAGEIARRQVVAAGVRLETLLKLQNTN
jgi:hypothetical protein